MSRPPRTGGRPLAGWRVPLRIARRDALRSRGRSLLVLVMIALPVLAVCLADVVLHTQDVRGTESLDRRLGSATALVTTQEGAGHVLQAPDPERSATAVGRSRRAPSASAVSKLLGGAHLVERRLGGITVVSRKGATSADATELDLREPVTRGLFELTSGRLPRTADEVVVNGALAEKGYAVGDALELVGDGARRPKVVGIAESTTTRTHPIAAGPLGSLGVRAPGSTAWLVDGPEVSWKEVRRLNEGGATVLSRSVLLHPPPDSQIPEQARSSDVGGTDTAALSVAVLVVVMALIEVVLLAGPAFAVGARRQSRALALLAAAGGTPRQARRVVLASAVVLGVTAAVIGVVLGVVLAFVLMPVVQSFSDTWFGPFQVPWAQLLGIAAFGVLSALLAAVVPAHIASRQDVVAVLAGRRGDRAPSLRSPLIGLVLVGLGVTGAVLGTSRPRGDLLIAASAIFSVLGMILLVAPILAGLSRLSKRLPLQLRYAIRDAARHRTRTVPAVAAVAATVAGVVALGIGSSSDAAENQATYQPSTAAGVGVLTGYEARPDWHAFRALARREVPDAEIHAVRGVPESSSDGSSIQVQLLQRGSGGALRQNYGSVLGSSVLVSDGALPPGLTGVSKSEAGRAVAALRAGGLVVLTNGETASASGPVRAVVSRYTAATDGSGSTSRKLDVSATFVKVPPNAGPQAVISSSSARAMGVPVRQVSLVLTGAEITKAQEQSVIEGAAAISPDSSFMVERGYQGTDATRIALLVLAGLGAVLMLGGTLTATFLALSDARPDLATLAAVGASPSTRRGVAAAYALVIGLVGAVLGALVGFVPGIAITYPLTRTMQEGGGSTGPFLDIPWLLILSLVVLLPAATALVVGLSARARLPLAARLA